MEIIYILGFVVLIVLILRQRDEITRLRKGLEQTFDQLLDIKSLLEDSRNNPSIQQEQTPTTEEQPVLPHTQPEEPVVVSDAMPDAIHEESHLPPVPSVSEYNERPEPGAVHNVAPEEAEPTLSWFDRFKRDNPDLEKFIGENLVNKIGIVILVLGISFFVKYAIDKDWINEPARVGIGMLCGGLLLGVAHRLRLKYKAFSSVLVAGAIAVFYFTIAIAFHDYKLFSQTTAFILMVIITAFSIFVSVLYNRQELAVLSIIGGFAVPFMVSGGEGNYHVLYTYLLILNAGMLGISYFRRWFFVNFVAFVLTIGIFVGWLAAADVEQQEALGHVLIYASVFYSMFALAFVLNNVLYRNKFTNYEIAALISNTVVYYAVGHYIVGVIAPKSLGLFTVVLALFNLLCATIIYKKYKFDKNIIYVLIGLALTLATITIPVQFSGKYITLFWACEAVLLFWLTKQSNLKGFTLAGIVVQWLAVISLLMDLQTYLGDDVPYHPGYNSMFLTGLIVIASLVLSYRLFKINDYSSVILGINFDHVVHRKIFYNLALVLGYVLPLIEIGYQGNAYFGNSATIYFFLYLYHMLYSSTLLFFSSRQSTENIKWANAIALFNMLVYIVIAYRLPLMEKEDMFIDEVRVFPWAMTLHYISMLCLLYQTWFFMKNKATNDRFTAFSPPYISWFLAFFIVYLLSTEVNIAFLSTTGEWEAFYEMKNSVIRVVFPVLWGILSFMFLIFGIRRNMKTARIIALSLLGITVLKLFLYDIRMVSETGKIIAFILLGVLILIISFVYQKIKKLIVDDNEKAG
ncbi:DUF2339 domain-containing protein [Sphingobacterium haloxyli]|uniref:DUF2339 domain-containing protein n=1 Tax=Sphingobacterium haloxyli TaxID=2100533 RepID=A0A2S9J7X0_9SPHI|nr:DUF2339 domain-containing protein [Sphingobacterium haloxyli]PRD48840.1 DUF2339 domain-containing protein [Sphingobacterium haloxyli]